jgi:CubicO group peptidase (beta-lactamase class C family)
MRRVPMLGVLCAALALAANANEVAPVFPGERWSEKSPQDLGLDAEKLIEARDYALSTGGSGLIVRGGHAVLRWGDQQQRYDLKSSTKSLGATLVGVALLDGKLRLDDPAIKHHPSLGIPPESNRETGWIEKITIRHLLTQTAGFQKVGGFLPIDFEPGTKWQYSDGGPNWLAECVTLAYRRDCQELMFERVCDPLEITREDFVWRKNQYRPHEIDGLMRREFGSGVHANVNALARIGLLYLRGGVWNGKRILPADYVAEAGKPAPSIQGLKVADGDPHSGASTHYGYLFWNNGDGTLKNVPRDAYWSWGLYDSFFFVIPSLDLVIARTSAKSWPRNNPAAAPYDVLKPFLEPIVAAATKPTVAAQQKARTIKDGLTPDEQSRAKRSPYPQSAVITGIEWAPEGEIVRKARGGDNWPNTWGADDFLYTAYGDANGFEPFLPKKLSIGIARVSGNPPEIKGENILSPTAEAVGDGERGRKASGMIMLEDGTLYMFVRNVGNSQVGWSTDQGRNWTWADWKFATSFGCPTILNFGKANAGARDNYVYFYSQDRDSAYERGDRMVLARVPKVKIRERGAYEFFVRRNSDGSAIWSRDINERGGIFENKGLCYRSSVSYNAPLKRYLWCQTGAGTDPRFAGGFSIFDAPEPWGPWTTVYHTDKWDVGPGETSSLPTKWMSADGKTIHLLFSGDDCFSVRKAVLTIK